MVLFSREILLYLIELIDLRLKKGTQASSGYLEQLGLIKWEDRRIFREIMAGIKGISFYWNTIHFVIQKTYRAMQKPNNLSNKEPILYILTYYRIYAPEHYPKIIEFISLEKAYFVKLPRFREFQNRLEKFSWEIALKNKNTLESISLRYSIPTYVLELLSSVMKDDEIEGLIKTINRLFQNGNTTFRINTLINDLRISEHLEKIQKELLKNQISFHQDSRYSLLFNVNHTDQPALMHTICYQESEIIIQDKGSYIVTEELNPQLNELIWDVCSAPGIKSSAIIEKNKGSTHLISTDFNKTRIFSMKNLIKRLVSDSIFYPHIIHCDALNPPFRERTQFDRILLDAPCTGSGTFPANPDLKWQQNPEFLERHIQLQKALLQLAWKFVRNNGILLYSTCSLYAEEGEYQIRDFVKILEKDKESIVQIVPPSIEYLKAYKIKSFNTEHLGRINSAIHETHGFFISIMRKEVPNRLP